MTRVSVIIPAHNAASFIAETIESVANQTCPAAEVIVIDDGSSDDTARVVSRLRDSLDRLCLLPGKGHGVSAARNAGIRESTGEIVAFLDHDDIWEPEKLARQVAVFDSDPQAGLVFTQARVEQEGVTLEYFPEMRDSESVLSNAYENLVHWNYIPMSAVAVRRSVLDELPGEDGPFDPRYRLSEDWDLWLRIAARMDPGGVRYIPEPLTRYRIVEGRATSRMADLRLEDIEIVRRQLREHPRLAVSNPGRVRSTLYRLHEEAGYWLLKEGRAREARSILSKAWRLRPASIKTLGYLLFSLVGGRSDMVQAEGRRA